MYSHKYTHTHTNDERPFVRPSITASFSKFAKKLSVLSMEWSGSFSREEYLALAHIIAEEDNPGVITLESFKRAADLGSVALAAFARPRTGNFAHGYYSHGDAGHGVGEIEGVQDDAGSRDSAVEYPGGEESETATDGKEKRGGGEKTQFSRDAVEATLRRAASEARWGLLARDNNIVLSIYTRKRERWNR